MDDLRTRIAAVVAAHRDQCGDCSCGWESWEESWDMHLADAVIAELDAELLDFGLWLSEELRGEPLSRIDAESCLQEWKWLNDESRWLKGETDAD